MTLKPNIWWKKFNFFSPDWNKNYWMVTEMCLPFSSIQWDWMSTEKVTEQCLKSGFQWTFREHLVDIQKCFSWLKGAFSSCVNVWISVWKAIIYSGLLHHHASIFACRYYTCVWRLKFWHYFEFCRYLMAPSDVLWKTLEWFLTIWSFDRPYKVIVIKSTHYIYF